MALPSTAVWEVETGGSDTLNGGSFDPGNTNMATDGAATSATGTAPVFSSASYNFVAGDMGAWLFIKSGTNWTPGWYKIASVASNAATLTASIGTAIQTTNFSLNGWAISTVTGCATTASPTGATWTIDYSQQASSISLTGLTTAAANAIILTTSATVAMVGNGIQITGGTNFTAGFYTISSISAGASLTVDRNCTTAAGVSGTAGVGGALASSTQLAAVETTANYAFFKSGTYTVTAITQLTAWSPVWEGYGTIRGDGAQATITCSTNSADMFNAAQSYRSFRYLNFTNTAGTPGSAFRWLTAEYTGWYWYGCSGSGFDRFIHGENFSDYPAVNVKFDSCEIKNCNVALAVGVGTVLNCYLHDNNDDAIFGAQNPVHITVINSVLANNGRSGIYIYDYANPQNLVLDGVIFYNNGSDGIQSPNTAPYLSVDMQRTMFINNGGYGINCNVQYIMTALKNRNNAYYNNTSGPRNNFPAGANDVTLTGNPFTNASGGDYSLNNTPGAGAACRAVGFPGVSLFGTGYADIGALQHHDANLGGALSVLFEISAASTNSGASVTTASQDTTGCNLLIVSVACYSACTLTDSYNNIWIPLPQFVGNPYVCQLYYCHGPIVGTGHTFTLTGGGSYAVIGVIGASGNLPQLDVQTGTTYGSLMVTSATPGTITPNYNNSLLVTCISLGVETALAIGSGYTASVQNYNSGQNIGGGIAYLIQTTATASNPSWSWTTASYGATAIAAFTGVATSGSSGGAYVG